MLMGCESSKVDSTMPDLGVPPSVMEEWINFTLSKAKDDAVPFNPTESIPSKFKNKHKQTITHLMGIDYSNLCKNGLPSDKAAQLHRALFVHSVGFFKHIQELVIHLKDSKVKLHVVMNVWKCFYMLLESC